MTNRYLLGAGVALAVALGGAQAHAQSVWWPTGTPWAWYIGPEGGWSKLPNNNNGTSPSVSITRPHNGTLPTPRFPALGLLTRKGISRAASMSAVVAEFSGARGG